MNQAPNLKWLKRSTFISKLSFMIFSLLINRPCHLESFISLVNEAKQRGTIREWVSTMPLYEMLGMYLYLFRFTISYVYSYRNFKRAHNFSSNGLFVNPGKAPVDVLASVTTK